MNTPRHVCKTLIVDDSAVARKLVELTLPRDEYSLLLAKTGQEALALFVEHHPALVIADWLMPDLSGIELCERIRAEARGAYTHIILVTGIADKAEIVKAFHAGADDYLTKPFYPEELLARAGVGRRTYELQQEIEAKNRLLEHLALTDGLTDLPNRRAIEEWALRQWSGGVRHGYSFWVVMADLDQFKSVNDNWRHNAGDEVLRKTSEIIKKNTRQCDMCARIGGEEFLMVLTHAEREGVRVAVERLRKQIATEKFIFGEREVKVTVSFGVAGLPTDGTMDLGQLIEQADAALYAAKRLGRNRVEFAACDDKEPTLGK